jgi:hypothetical protein
VKPHLSAFEQIWSRSVSISTEWLSSDVSFHLNVVMRASSAEGNGHPGKVAVTDFDML